VSRRPSIAWAAALLVALPSAAGDAAPPAAPKVKVDGPPRAQPGLVDCRSPVVAHETLVPSEAPLVLPGATVTFATDKGKVVATVMDAPESPPRVVNLGKDPALLELKAFGGKYGLSVRPDPHGAGVLVSSAWGLHVALGADDAYWVDSDRDGRLGSAGDGLVAPGSRTVAPWCGEIWSRALATTVKEGAEAGTFAAAPIEMPRGPDGDHGAAWRLLQWRRQQCGILPCAYDPSLERGMVAHAKYLSVTGTYGHDEDPRNAAYTDEGAHAGKACVLLKPAASCVEGVLTELATLFHRHGCLAPGLARSAIVRAHEVFLLDVETSKDGPLGAAVVVWPPHGMLDADPRFHPGGERPMPVPVAPGAALGTCIGLRCPPWTGSTLAREPGFLFEVRAGTSALSNAVVHGPGKPSKSSTLYDDAGIVAVVPLSPLPPQTPFHARCAWPDPRGVAGQGRFAYEWDFATGR
jgi:hypothetical protein